MVLKIGAISASLAGANEYTTDKTGVTQNGAGTRGMRIKGYFNLSISGTWVGTLTIQRSFDNGTTWNDISRFTANTEVWDQEIESSVLYRIGFKTGEYTSGTATVRISK